MKRLVVLLPGGQARREDRDAKRKRLDLPQWQFALGRSRVKQRNVIELAAARNVMNFPAFSTSANICGAVQEVMGCNDGSTCGLSAAMLDDLGHRVFEASSGRQALKAPILGKSPLPNRFFKRI
ncbi:MAG TPA: hypothetical protein VGR70_10095 [Stellaceae bacterium]|nr:hypothetical protein [Stellaceae bacterium]